MNMEQKRFRASDGRAGPPDDPGLARRLAGDSDLAPRPGAGEAVLY
jgi:hypothetical protein